MNKTELKKLKKVKNKLDSAILGYCDGNVAQELDEAFAIIDEVIKENKRIKKSVETAEKILEKQIDSDWLQMQENILEKQNEN